MTLKSAPRILIVDDDRDKCQELKDLIGTMGIGDCQIEAPVGLGTKLIEEAIRIARFLRPHVAIIDLRLLGDDSRDELGLTLMEDLGDAQCILYSAYLKTDITDQAFLKYGAFGAADKDGDPAKLVEKIRDALSKTCASMRQINLEYSAEIGGAQAIATKLSSKDMTIIPEVVEDLICGMFPHSPSIRIAPLDTYGRSSVSPRPVSRGRSMVFKVTYERIQPTVIKLAPIDNIVEEYKNYTQYVNHNLKGSFYAQIDDESSIFKKENRPPSFWELGAVRYRFLSERHHKTFTEAYRRVSDLQCLDDELIKPLNHYFTEVWGDLYKERTELEDNNLYQAYNKIFKLDERITRFPNHEAVIRFPGLLMALPNPITWVSNNWQRSEVFDAKQAVTHGDLHGDNLFVGEGYSWPIDFERTKPGHILRDPTELEVDIITRMFKCSRSDFSLLYELAIIATMPEDAKAYLLLTTRIKNNPSVYKAFLTVQGLRKIATDQMDFNDMNEYLWGLLLDSIFVACLSKPDSYQRDQALLLGSVICGRLEVGPYPWPPRNWDPISEQPPNTSPPHKKKPKTPQEIIA